MKKSTVFSVIGLVLAISGLLIGLQSIGADSWEQLGIIFILPSFLAFIIIVFDLLVTVGKIKRGLIYSCISSIIKICIIIYFIPSTIYDYNYQMKYGVSNLSFDLILIAILIIITIPSVLNVVRLLKSKNKL